MSQNLAATQKKLTTGKICPLCRFPLHQVGRVVWFCDDAGQHFSFNICSQCTGRLDCLPKRQQYRQIDIAVGNIAQHLERYEVLFFADRFSASAFVVLEAERMRESKSD